MEWQMNEVVETKVSSIAKGRYVLINLLKIIATYLDIKDLCSLAQTCRHMRETVAKEMQFRCPQRVLVYEKENFYVLQGFVNVTPHLVMLFSKHDFSRDEMRERTLCRQFMKHFPDMLVTLGFDNVYTEANVIKVNSSDFDEKINFVNFENCELPGLLIPDHSSVDIKIVWCSLYSITAGPFLAIFNSLKTKYEKSALLLFTHGINKFSYREAMMNSFIQCFSKNQCTLWGCELFYPPYVYDSKVDKSNISDSAGFFAVNISNPNLKTYSLVLDIFEMKSNTFYEKIQRFSNKVRFRSKSIGLVIAPHFEDFKMKFDGKESYAQACEESGYFYKLNYERRLIYYFKKVFPGICFTFLFQDNALRVFGHSYEKDKDQLYHAMSVSLMIITHN